MRIGLDLGVHGPKELGGIWQLLKGVIEELCTTYDNHSYVLFCSPSHQSLVDSLPSIAKVIKLPQDQFLTSVDQLAREERIDVLFRRYPVEDDLVFPLAKQVVLIPDIQHEAFPEFFAPEDLRSRRVAFTRVLSNAGAIGTISAFSKARLVARPETRCTDVFLMGPALAKEHAQHTRDDFTPEELALIPKNKYFIYPANLWPHKNHNRILQAFDLCRNSTDQQMEFVLTGNEEGWPMLREAFPALPVRHLGYVRPQLLRLLMERATALVFFSLYEGFGIPLLEAFNVGTPVLCSNTTSLPEIGGDAVLSCDPKNIEAMSLLMRNVVEDSALRGKLAPKGKARLSLFSWEASTANLIAACERVAAKPFVLSYDAVLGATQNLGRQLRASEADRAARLEVIQRLDAEVTRHRSKLAELQVGLAASEAERARQLNIIQEQAKILDRRIVKLLLKWIRFGRG